MENENKEQSVEQLFYEFMESDTKILNWKNKINPNVKYVIEVDRLQGYTTFQATFQDLTDLDYKILEEAQKGSEILFEFSGQYFQFEMGVNPNKLMVDNGIIGVFDMPLKEKPVILRFIQIINE